MWPALRDGSLGVSRTTAGDDVASVADVSFDPASSSRASVAPRRPRQQRPNGHAPSPPPGGPPLERLAPADDMAERAVLGSVLIDDSAFDRLTVSLAPDSFYRREHGWIWAAMQALHSAGTSIDLITLGDELMRAGHLDEVGGPAYLSGLMLLVPHATRADEYARIVAAKALSRRAIAAAGRLAAAGYEDSNDPDLLLERMRAIHDDVARSSVGAGGSTQARATGAGIDAAALLALDLAPLHWVVPDLVPEGTTILAAPPKIGKSCLVYQIAVEAAIGGELFGRRVTPGSVLYLALEDGQRRGQDRLRAALAGRTMPAGRLEVRWSAPTIGNGLEEELVGWLDQHPDAVMVAIDTLQRVRSRSSGQRNAYEVDVEDLGRLQALFRDRRVALVIVHHAAKAAQDDFLASVSGTYGITGSADTIVVVRRKRLESFGTILVTGRDVADAEISARFDGLTWSAAPAAMAAASFERAEVFEVIRTAGPLFPKAIADRLDKTRESVAYLVEKLVAEGAVVRVAKGYAATAVEEPGLARARVDHLPPTAPYWGSKGSEGGHVRAHACATCGSAPIGVYPDGSARFGCGPHSPVYEQPGALA